MLETLSQHLAVYPSDGLVFTNTEGRPVLKHRLAVTSRNAAESAGLESVSFRDLRHHYASLLIHGGESVKAVQARLGHSSASITLDVYSHLWPDSEDRTRHAVDGAWGRSLEDFRGLKRPRQTKTAGQVRFPHISIRLNV